MTAQLPPLDHIPADLVSAADYQRYAARHMSANARAYVDSAAADELSHAANLAAFARRQLQTQVLADVRGGHCRSELFGLSLSHPLLLAPVAYQKLVHADGERAAAYAATAMLALAGMVFCSRCRPDRRRFHRTWQGSILSVFQCNRSPRHQSRSHVRIFPMAETVCGWTFL